MVAWSIGGDRPKPEGMSRGKPREVENAAPASGLQRTRSSDRAQGYLHSRARSGPKERGTEGNTPFVAQVGAAGSDGAAPHLAGVGPSRRAGGITSREVVFLVLSGFFLAILALLNVLGLTRFVDLSFTIPLTSVRVPMPIAVGVLPYPITFLCTDLVSELYGRRHANALVWTGLAVNVWVALILWLGGVLPGYGPESSGQVFFEVRKLAFGAVTASMVAYMAAQFADVQAFHLLKRLTRGRHLWLRNNGSTLLSQWVDCVAAVLVTHYLTGALPIDAALPLAPQLLTYMAAGYVFKGLAAMVDTLPCYYLVRRLRPLVGPPADDEAFPNQGNTDASHCDTSASLPCFHPAAP